jgi:glyoxalase superfamily protein/pterin 4 alpha carbinolamine dehydratase
MSETVTPKRFHEAEWRVVRDDASTHFRTGSFAAGVALVNAIGRLADDANHHADVDLRPVGVTDRPPLSGAADLVPTDGRAAPAAQQDPHRCLCAHDQAEARVAAALAAGGHVVSDQNAPGWWTLADAEGNEVDVASWPDRD